MSHALRVTLGLTDTEHYVLTRLGNGNDPLFCYQIEDVEYAVTIADCVAGARLDFGSLFEANEAQNQILRALEKLEVILQQDARTDRVETFNIPQEDHHELGRNHDTYSRPRAKTRGNRSRAARHPQHRATRAQGA